MHKFDTGKSQRIAKRAGNLHFLTFFILRITVTHFIILPLVFKIMECFYIFSVEENLSFKIFLKLLIIKKSFVIVEFH